MTNNIMNPPNINDILKNINSKRTFIEFSCDQIINDLNNLIICAD
jgi:hypothetical protein